VVGGDNHIAGHHPVSAGSNGESVEVETIAWRRLTSTKACNFCVMLADRGAVYWSEQTASFKPHDNCACFPVAEKTTRRL